MPSTSDYSYDASQVGNTVEEYGILPEPSGPDSLERSSRAPVASEYNWNKHKAKIQRLYMKEEMTLKEVMQVMREEHGFHANTKTFKSRLRSWGFRKNITLKEDGLDNNALRGIISGNTRGRVQLANGHTVDSDRLAVHLRRKLHGRRHTGQTTQQAPRPYAVKPPEALYISETVLFQVRSYILGRYQGTVTTVEALERLRQTSPSVTKWQRFTYAVKGALEKNRAGQALILMRQAPQELRLFLQDQPADVLASFMMFLVYVTRRSPQDSSEANQFLTVVKSLIRYGECVAADGEHLRLPSTHPLRQMLRTLSLTSVGHHELNQLATRAWRLSLQTWDDMPVSPGTTTGIGDWMNYSAVSSLSDLPPNFGSIVDKTVKKVEAQYGEDHQRTIKALRTQAEYLSTVDSERGLDEHLNDRILGIFKDLLRRGAQGAPKVVAYRFIAESHQLRGEQGPAEENMRKAIDAMREAFGEREPMVLTWVSELEDWLTEWGQDEKAAGMARWRGELQQGGD